MQEIIAEAAALGKKIAEHPRSRAFFDAARAAVADPEAQKLLRAYQEAAERLHELEASGKPIEPEDKRRLAALQSEMIGNEKLKAMLKAQADYVELMTHVQQAIEAATQG
jgi:cell fate (sporulation/competence/biofilm development) regulator YlbF (YheA/YmcA/DUF963 family)